VATGGCLSPSFEKTKAHREGGFALGVQAHLLGMLLSPALSTSMHSTPALTQLRHAGRAPSQRIFLVRHLWQAVTIFFFGFGVPGVGVDNEEVDADLDLATWGFPSVAIWL